MFSAIGTGDHVYRTLQPTTYPKIDIVPITNADAAVIVARLLCHDIDVLQNWPRGVIPNCFPRGPASTIPAYRPRLPNDRTTCRVRVTDRSPTDLTVLTAPNNAVRTGTARTTADPVDP